MGILNNPTKLKINPKCPTKQLEHIKEMKIHTLLAGVDEKQWRKQAKTLPLPNHLKTRFWAWKLDGLDRGWRNRKFGYDLGWWGGRNGWWWLVEIWSLRVGGFVGEKIIREWGFFFCCREREDGRLEICYSVFFFLNFVFSSFHNSYNSELSVS